MFQKFIWKKPLFQNRRMTFPFKQDDSLAQYDDESMPKLKLRHSPYTNRYGFNEKALFSSKEIATHSDPFDICAPGVGTGDAMLQMQNPPLLAFRNKTSKTTSRPNLTSPTNKTRPIHQTAQTSLLANRRPLSALKNPEIHSLDVVRKQIEQEKMTINFQEDPVAYFSKRKDGRGHRFIYLVYKGDPKGPYFSPYELEKVPFAEIKGDYFTMSATGVTHVYQDGTTDTISLDLWAQEKSIFNSIRKLKTFSQFFYWKPFRIWKNFVMHQRYSELDNTVILHPFFKNKEFFSHALFMFNRQTTAKELLHKFLLAFQSQRKFRLEEFESTNKSNIEHLKIKWDKFVTKTQQEVLSLYTTISNPKLVQVHDSDFPDIKRRNPNLAQLMVLEKRKAAKRAAKTEAVNRQIIEIGGFIRMIDYMLLESLSEGCIEAWKIAESNVASEQASVFVVDVIYDNEGKVSFKPTLDVLIESVTTILHESLKTLNLLPRLLMQLPMKPFLRDNGLDYVRLFEQGPQFSQIVDKSILDGVREHIIEIINISYREAFEVSQSFSNFYSIFRMGETWSVQDYLITPDNQKFTGQLTDETPVGLEPDEFLLKPNEQPIIDFKRVQSDINQYREDKKRIENMRNGAVRGALFIDSRGLKGNLAPIPQRALTELEELLSKLASTKREKVKQALRYYSRKLKQDPQTLEDYVSFCEILERCQKTTQQIQNEIEFVDKLFKMFDMFGFPHEENSNHTLFQAFCADKRTALNTRKEHLGIFTEALKMSLGDVDNKINKFYEKATSIPTTLKDADVEQLLPAAKKLCVKIDDLKSKVEELQMQQKTINVALNDFKAYAEVKTAAAFSVQLYEAVGQWHELSRMMTKIPFKITDTEKFKKEVESLNEAAVKLQASAPNNYPILNELMSKIQEISPYVEQLEQLAHGKMQLRHWNMLFESCNHKDEYHEEITIEELLTLKILHAKDKIEEITATSQGESELEGEFVEIMNHWNKVQMPLAESQIKNEDTLLLGPTDPLLLEIQDTLATLSRMLALPYVQGIRENVSSLSSNLENLSLIIEAWQLFQSNWIILSALFNIDEAKNVLPHQANRFQTVQRKWSNIARHTLKDTRLFSVCAYPSLLESLKENNTTMEQILASLGKFLDTKRQAIPRLFFLGNEEVLTLSTTSNFALFTSILTKIFMHVARIDCHEHDGAEGEAAYASNNLQRLKIYGLVGEDGDSIQFQRHIQCGASMETWVNQLIDTMKTTVKDSIAASIPGCQSGSFIDWVMTTPTYIAFITLNVVFCNEMEECFATYESNPRAFQQYESILKRRIEDTSDSFLLPLSSRDEQKLNIILTQLLGFRDRFKNATEKIQNHSPYLEWLHSLRFRFLPNSASISVEFSDFKWDHGYEYWGKTPNLIHTPMIDAALSDCIYSFSQNQLPMLTSSAASAKQIMGATLACLFGTFAYIARPFPDMSEYFLSRILAGVVSTGALAIFSSIEQLSTQSLCYLFDNVNSIITSVAAGNPRITISSHLADLNKNTRILLTADSNFMSYESIPPQLKSFARPISLLVPNYSKIIEVHLTAIGFRETKTITPKFSAFIHAIQPSFHKMLPNLSLSSRILAICNKANEMVHKMRVTLTEDLAIALYAYESFATICDDARTELLQSILYNSFQIGNSVEYMMERMKAVKNESTEAQLRVAVEKEVSSLALDLPSSQYLANQVLTLYSTMLQYNCVIITGPPCSGKSIILDVLRRTFERSEIKEALPNQKPMNILSLFHMSDKWSKIYGSVFEDLDVGPMYSYGLIHSAIHHLLKNINKSHQILKFDGKLTRKFSTYLSEFFGSPTMKKNMLNSLDSFYASPNFHVIIETDSLESATPSLLAKSGIIVMKSLQSDIPYTQIRPSCELIHPSVPFARALKACFDCIDTTNSQVIKSIYCEVAPLIVNKVYTLKNDVCSSELPTRISNGHILLGEILPMYAGILAMRSIDYAGVNQSDEDQIRLCTILSFARMFYSVLKSSEVSSFNTWLCSQFHIDLPNDWVGFTVSTSFSEYFTRPMLMSMRFNKGELIPLSSSKLEKPPILRKTEESSKLPFYIDQISVIHPQILPALHMTKLLLMARQNILIHGPNDSGKSSFLPMIFAEMKNVEPIMIKSSKFLTGKAITDYLCTHTQIVSKSKNSSSSQKNFVLVFDGVESHHFEIMEFIRMLIMTHKIPKFSPNDQKVFEFAELYSFSVIVTARNFADLPSRFQSCFAPIGLTSITETTAQFIGSKILQHYGFKEALANRLMKAAIMVLSQYHHMSTIHDVSCICSTLCFIEDKESETVAVNGLLSELYFTSLHRYPTSEFSDKVAQILKDDFPNQANTIDMFLSFTDLQYPSFDFTNNTFIASYKHHPLKTLQEELKYYLTVYNTNSIEKISLRFTSVTTRQWALLYRSLTRPGSNAVLIGKESSGRYIMSRFAAHMIGSDFVLIESASPDEMISLNERETTIFGTLKEVIKNAIINQKKSVIYIRASHFNERDVRLVADFATKYSFISFFAENELEELYEKVLSVKPATSSQRQQARVLIMELLRSYIHAVINLGANCRYNVDYNRFDQILFDSDCPENFESVVSIALENPEIKVVVGQDESKVQSLMPKIADIARKYTRAFCPNKFYDFVDSFTHYGKADFKDIENKNKNILSALNFIKNLQEESTNVNKRLESLAPTLQRLQVDPESLQSSYNTRKEAIETRRSKLDQEHKLKAAEVEELDAAFAEHEKEREKLQPVCEQTLREVEKLTDNDIETIRITAADPQPCLRLLMEMFCIFLDLTPSYERSGQKLLMGPQFVPTLISKINSNSINEKLLEEVQPYFEKEEMSAQNLDGIAPALRSLYDWVDSLYKMARLNIDLAKEKSTIDEKHRQLNEYIEEMNLEISSIEQVEKTLESESKALIESNKSREAMEKEYQEVDQRKKSIDSIFQGIETLTKKWEEESNNFAQTSAKLIGNTILFAFYLVFCGSMSPEEKTSSLSDVVRMLKETGIGTSYNDPVQSITDRFIASKLGQNAQQDDLILNSHHASLCLRTPLIVDPDGIVYNLLTSSISLKKLITVSQSVSNLEQVIGNAISDGKTLVLTDCEYMHPLVSSVLDLIMTEPDQHMSLNIRIGSKLVTWDSKFKIVLFTRRYKLTELPMSLLSRVTIIDASHSSLKSTQAAFERAFIEYFDADLLPKLQEMKREEASHRVQIIKHEKDTLDILADIIATQASKEDYDYLSDENTVSDLIHSKEAFLKANSTPPDFSALRKEHRTMIEPFNKHIQLCQIFWKVMSRDLPIVNNSAHFSFTYYQKHITSVISNAGLHTGTLSAEQHSTLGQSITNATFQFIFQTLPIRDTIFFMFMSAFMIKESNKILSSADLQIVLEHIATEVDKSADLQAEDVAVGDNFEHLKFANIVYLFKYITQFVTEQFGEEYQTLLPFFQFDTVITNAASTPTIVMANDYVNPTALIQYFVSLRTRHENLNIVSLCEDMELIKSTKKMITTAMNRGTWVIVHYTHPSKAAASMLTDIYTLMSTTTVNTNFRLIVIAGTTRYLCRSFIIKAKRVDVETFPSIRHSMLSIFQHHSSSIRSTTNPRAMKKLAYASALLLSILNFRNFITPVGFISRVRLNDLSFKDFIEQLRIIIDAHPNDAPLKNLRTQIDQLICASVGEIHDRIIIAAHTAAMIKPDTLDDGFSITPRSTEKEMWTIPGEIPLANFTQIIQQIPIFTSTEVLHMSSQILLNWNLSIWCTKPFKLYAQKRKSIDFQSALMKLDNFLMLLPEKLEISNLDKLMNPLGIYLITETEKLNEILFFVKSELNRFTYEFMKRISSENGLEFASGHVPKEWAKRTNIWNFTSVNSFASHIIERHAQLMRCLQEGSPVVFDMRLLEYPNLLLQSFILSCALDEGQPVDTLSYQFTIIEGTPNIEAKTLFLTRLFLANGEFKDGNLVINAPQDTPPFKQISALVAKVVRSSSKQAKCYSVPMFKDAILSSMAERIDNSICRIENGESKNFVWNVNLPTEVPEIDLQQYGTTIFCRMPEQFI
ncbi:Dynein heavy chain family protein [Tritrichomonas foetus]|uniref:Dynein heavy chain family protein n=1 Tax=Tritrichomonas foetus TaxID=1144522 RepID=A0A1J4K4E6_9EUKA|nr:Dynein heavy chain family protein [Tritrichomonas foetus]|eukprot:OHT05712.1 Dynein heavy chain family protein [Tritrichomonas foetus]